MSATHQTCLSPILDPLCPLTDQWSVAWATLVQMLLKCVVSTQYFGPLELELEPPWSRIPCQAASNWSATLANEKEPTGKYQQADVADGYKHAKWNTEKEDCYKTQHKTQQPEVDYLFLVSVRSRLCRIATVDPLCVCGPVFWIKSSSACLQRITRLKKIGWNCLYVCGVSGFWCLVILTQTHCSRRGSADTNNAPRKGESECANMLRIHKHGENTLTR